LFRVVGFLVGSFDAWSFVLAVHCGTVDSLIKNRQQIASEALLELPFVSGLMGEVC
jgi:hypothetical protein